MSILDLSTTVFSVVETVVKVLLCVEAENGRFFRSKSAETTVNQERKKGKKEFIDQAT